MARKGGGLPILTSGNNDNRRLRARLLRWYEGAKRDLPWRATTDPYRVWISEVMLQQTRVAAVLPYYERFLARFPDVHALAAAPEQDLLACWAGLGYYSRARNLQKAARTIVHNGGFPADYESIRALPGIGDYTAAAISSIAFGLPYAVLDGNVLRVLARLSDDPADIGTAAAKRRFGALARELLDPRRPADFNQAIMELGATVCLPRQPRCAQCPWRDLCEARRQGTQLELPVKPRRTGTVQLHRTLLVIRRNGRLLLWQRPANALRLAGFWELPETEQLSKARILRPLGEFRHSITNHDYHFSVAAARVADVPEGFVWKAFEDLPALPLSTTARKALGHSQVLIL